MFYLGISIAVIIFIYIKYFVGKNIPDLKGKPWVLSDLKNNDYAVYTKVLGLVVAATLILLISFLISFVFF